jgi:WD40 repeat protein
MQPQPQARKTMKKHVILFLAANPRDTGRLALDREARSIHLELKRSGHRDRFDFVTRWAAEPLDLLRELRELKPTIVHFSEHGDGSVTATAEAASGRGIAAPAPAGGLGGLYFHSATGGLQVVTPEAIIETFGAVSAQVRLVVLNACYTAPIAEALRAHVDCVVGMSGAIHGDAARSFAIGFYGGLGEHESVAAAFRQGRAAIHLDGLPDADRPQLRVRDGFDASQLILAAFAPSGLVAAPCPYPGMRPFAADDTGSFHGREAEITELIGRLRAGQREIFVIGPSGSGKSSLVAAGVLPRLARGLSGLGPFVVRELRPGDQPFSRLCRVLDAPPGQPLAAAERVAALLAHRASRASVLIVVDQLEELFTQASTDERATFLDALRTLRTEPRCAVIYTLRADFSGALMESPLWPERPAQLSRVDVIPLRDKALREAIAAPAEGVGVTVEPELIERLVADAASEPGILPLLQETLVQLWDARADQTLTLAGYQALGDGVRSGLAVALARRADATLQRFNAAQTDIARRILLRLISFGEGRSDTRRQQPRTQLRAAGDGAADFAFVLQTMVDDRLLTIDDDVAGEPRIDLAHEIMISAWPTLASWIGDHRLDEQRRRQFETAAEQYHRGSRGLLDPIELADAEEWQQTESAAQLGMSAEVMSLVVASRTAHTKQRRLRRGLIAGAFALLAGFAIIVAFLAITARNQRVEAETQRRAAVHILGEQYREAGRQLVVEGHAQRAIPYLVAARDQGIDDPPLRALFHTATASAVRVALHHDGPVVAVEFSDDGSRVVTGSADGTARVWDAATGSPLTPRLRHPRPVTGAKIRGDGTRVLTISDRTVRIWEVTASPSPPLELRHADRINAAEFSADGALIATASDDRTARLWSVATGQPMIAPLVHDVKVVGVALSRDVARIATTVADGIGGALWNAKTGTRIAALEENVFAKTWQIGTPRHRSLVTSATFSPDSRNLVTTGTDDIALVWDATTGKTRLPPLRHSGWVMSAAFSPDGAKIATVDAQGHIGIWDAATGAATTVAIDASAVVRVTYSRDGTRMLGVGNDKRARIWDTASGNQVAVIELESGAIDAAVTSDGVQVATASADGRARIWELRRAMQVVGVAGDYYDAAYSPDGSRIATTGTTGALQLWTAQGQLVAKRHLLLGAFGVAFDRDGTQIGAIGIDGSVEVGDTASVTLRPFHDVMGKDPTGAPDGPEEIIGHPPPRGAFSPDGRRFATLTGAHRAAIWDIASGQTVMPPLQHAGPVLMIRWSPDGRRVITASEDATARIWDAATGATLGAPLAHPADTWVTAALFTPDGNRIVTLCTDRNVRVWDAASGELQTTLSGHADYIIAATVSPDGTLLLTNSNDNSARLWNLATGQLAVPPLEHGDWVVDARFSPDGTRIVTTSGKLTQIWDVRTGLPLAPPFVCPDFARTAMFSPDGSAVLAVWRTGAGIWDAGLDPGSLDDWHRLARDSSFPQLGQALEGVAERAVTR